MTGSEESSADIVPLKKMAPPPYEEGAATRIFNRQPTVRYDPVGICIYCKRPRYRPDSAEPPRTEHIVAQGIAGALELPTASCKKCEAATSGVESKIIATMFAGGRERLALRSKAKRLSTPRVPITVRMNEQQVTLRLPVDAGHPTVLILPTFRPPRLMSRDPTATGFAGLWAHTFFPNDDPLPSQDIYSPPVDVLLIAQMLAKIAHSFAAATVRLERFTPCLTDFIRKRYDRKGDHKALMPHGIFEFIGGTTEAIAPSSALHEVAADCLVVGGKS